MNVVAALQSPTLLNILASSSSWSLRACAMGDHEGLAENSELKVPMWGPHDGAPSVVLICTPAHREYAERVWPGARLLWVLHNGYERGLLPPGLEAGLAGVVCFSNKVKWLGSAGRSVNFHYVSPAYEAAPVWSWCPGKLWSLRNRPDSRRDDIDSIVAAVVGGMPHTFYGQGQAAGFADAALKAQLRARSSAYVSCMMRGSGFGLAEHEALAAGVPVVGDWWGDLYEELPRVYWGISHDLYEAGAAATRLAASNRGAKELSEMGLEYIRKHRTQSRMDETISEMLRQVG